MRFNSRYDQITYPIDDNIKLTSSLANHRQRKKNDNLKKTIFQEHAIFTSKFSLHYQFCLFSKKKTVFIPTLPLLKKIFPYLLIKRMRKYFLSFIFHLWSSFQFHPVLSLFIEELIFVNFVVILCLQCAHI